jgi:exopolyphosphatase / guanosine-5'-triphosphate,3'-diphosphate pyrophosphatase
VRVAAIDLGTNSFLCLIADVEAGKIKKVVEDVTHLVRIGEKVHETKMLQPQALARAEKSFATFQELIQKHKCEKVLAVATSAARDVKNGNELIALGAKYGIPIKIISGDQEAMLTFTGMAFDRPTIEGVVGIDIGGGSTEIIRKEGTIKGKSVDVGCVRLTELFVTEDPIKKDELKKLREFAREKLSVFPKMNPREAIAVAGTPCALACVEKNIPFNAEAVHGTVLTRKTVQKWAETLAGLSVEDRLKIPGLDRGRADVIVAGAVILDVVGEIIGAESFTVSVLGARYGLALAVEGGKI